MKSIFTQELENTMVYPIPTSGLYETGDFDNIKKVLITKVTPKFVSFMLNGFEQEHPIAQHGKDSLRKHNYSAGFWVFTSQVTLDAYILQVKVQDRLNPNCKLTSEQAAGIAKVMGWTF